MTSHSEIIQTLYDIGAVQFGQFELKSGIVSPIYLDLRVLVSYPRALRQVAVSMAQVLRPIAFDRLAAIPYAALPIGTAVALEMNRPMVYPRREKKAYGTGRMVEGKFEKGERVVVLDDVITTGSSKVEAIEPLVNAGLQVQDVVVLIDREQGGSAELAVRGYRVHAVMKISEIVEYLLKAGRISDEQYREVMTLVHGAR